MSEENAFYDDLCYSADQMSPTARFELYTELLRQSPLASLLTVGEVRYMAGLSSSPAESRLAVSDAARAVLANDIERFEKRNAFTINTTSVNSNAKTEGPGF